METPRATTVTAEDLARQIQADLRSRGLKPGDRYLTSEQARAKFAVRKGLINQSMRILADRNILVRQRRAGTFVGKGFETPAAAAAHADAEPGLRAVHILMAMDYYRTRVVPAERFVDALGRLVPRATVQIHYVPEATAVEHVRQVVDGVAGKPGEALILIRAPREAQLLVERGGVPAIVFGSVYPDVKLPALDMDQAGAAQLAVRYAVARGRRNFLLMMRDQWRQGDNLLLQGATRELAQHGVGLDCVDVASVPPQQQVIAEELRRRLHGAESMAVLCRGTFVAEPAVEVIQAEGLRLGEDIDVINLQGSPEQRPCCPTVVSEWTYEEQIVMLGRELMRAVQGKGSPRMVRVPVSLVDERGRALSAGAGGGGRNEFFWEDSDEGSSDA